MTIWVKLLENDESIGVVLLNVEATEQITISRIVSSAINQYSEVLHSASNFHVYSGLDNTILLDERVNWNNESHGGHQFDDALLMKYSRPDVTNQQITDGTCAFVLCYHRFSQIF